LSTSGTRFLPVFSPAVNWSRQNCRASPWCDLADQPELLISLAFGATAPRRQDLAASLLSVHAVSVARFERAGLNGGSTMTVKFFPNDKGNPPGKLADAELHFSGGPLDGLKLIGFSIWERKTGGRNVTFPARQYTVNGERRSFALLRPLIDASSQEKLRDLILDAYKEHEAALAEAV
jgi:hypothetical protein